MTECSHCNIQDTDQSCISLVPIFSNLTHSEIHQIAQITTSRNFEKGEIIFMAGDKGDRALCYPQGQGKDNKAVRGRQGTDNKGSRAWRFSRRAVHLLSRPP